MTVDELLERIAAAYPGATAEAMKAYKPVFHARLDKHEGERLGDAATAVLGTFNPTARKPFPNPGDFEAHLPVGNVHAKLESLGPALDMAGHRARKIALVEAWQASQGPKIRAARGPAIYGHCLWEAQRLSSARAWSIDPQPVVLTAEQIQKCEDQAVSSARMDAHGAAPLRFADGAAWKAQMDNCRALLRAGQWPRRMVDQPDGSRGLLPPVSQSMRDRLAALAKARRDAVAGRVEESDRN